MKLLILIVCLGFAAADLRRAAAPVIDDALSAFKEGMGKPGSLRHALGMPEAVELDEVEKDIVDELEKKIREKLDDLYKKIQEKIDHGKEVASNLLEEVKKYKEQLKELGKDLGEKGKEFLKKLKDKAKDSLKKLLEKLGLGKRNLQQEYDVVARSRLRDFLEKIKEDILSNETIRKIREYIRDFVTNNPTLQAIKDFLLKLKDGDLRELLRGLFDHRRDSRDVKEVWEKVKDWFKNLKESLKEKTIKFREWLKEKLDTGFEKLKDKYGLIKAVALEVIAHAKDIHGEIAREALEFFRPYKEDLGSLWNQLKEALKEHIGSF